MHTTLFVSMLSGPAAEPTCCSPRVLLLLFLSPSLSLSFSFSSLFFALSHEKSYTHNKVTGKYVTDGHVSSTKHARMKERSGGSGWLRVIDEKITVADAFNPIARRFPRCFKLNVRPPRNPPARRYRATATRSLGYLRVEDSADDASEI